MSKFVKIYMSRIEIRKTEHNNPFQATYHRSSEYQLIDNAQYFIERIEEIRKDNYLPTEQDILRCRVLTKGIHTIKFQIKDVTFQYEQEL